MCISAVIFDLDGVIVSTDEYHYQAWRRLFSEENIEFDREINQRLRGVSRMESLEIGLKKSKRRYTDQEKVELAERKNSYYRNLLNSLSPDDILPGVLDVLPALRERGIITAIASSSKNASFILKKIGLSDVFDAIVDGNEIRRSKPDPEVFIKAAQKLGVLPKTCLVVEDAQAGIDAALAGGMKCVGVGSASGSDNSTFTVESIAHIPSLLGGQKEK